MGRCHAGDGSLSVEFMGLPSAVEEGSSRREYRINLEIVPGLEVREARSAHVPVAEKSGQNADDR